jgi:SH3-like domain-containing protein
VAYTFKRPGAPVKVIAESIDHWRKIEDASGDKCWTHQSRLTGQSHVFTLAETPLFVLPNPDKKLTGTLAPNLLAKIEKRSGDWIRVSVGGVRGWTPSAGVWGGRLEPESP